jgi:class 3 adenylate cyclase/tetratricopeptide (TPR) repeat protein
LRQKVVLVMDVVESVRLMGVDEVGVVQQIHRLLGIAREDVAPRHRGRVVKSLGDGILCEFADARGAVAAAFELHRVFDQVNLGLEPARRLYLRAGVNGAPVYIDATDIFGTGVNLAARLCMLAGPGETVAAPAICEELVDGIDVNLVDLGECHLKHVDAPVRAFRLSQPGVGLRALSVSADTGLLKATVAVVPLKCLAGDQHAAAIGDLVADGVIHQLGRTGALRVLSRLSTRAFRGDNFGLEQLREHLGASYVLSGSFAAAGDTLLIQVELAQVSTMEVVWTERLNTSIGDLLRIDSEAIQSIANGTHRQILESEAAKCLVAPLPTLPSYAMLLASIQMMHRQSRAEFARALTLLESLSERHPRMGTPYAWIGKWYALCAAQNWSSQPSEDLWKARSAVDRALTLEDSHALALTVRGLIAGYVSRDYEAAHRDYEAALMHNPSEPLAWLYRGTLAAWTGSGQEAISHVDNALALSPIDPMRYYFESLASVAHIAGGKYESAAALAAQSLRRNKAHTSTHKALVLALTLSGKHQDGRRAAQELLGLEPSFTVAQFLDKSPLAGSPNRMLFAEAYAEAGIPRT